jgi:hypothetical protein
MGSLGSVVKREGETNIFNTIATVIFFLTILAYGGVYFYKNMLITQTNKAKAELEAARQSFELDKIQDILNANTRVLTTKNLLLSHVVTSELFGALEKSTLKKMRITSLSYKGNNGSPTLSMTGEVQTYNALAEQERIFSESEDFKNSTLSNFALTQNGNITVAIFANIDPKLISYKRIVEESKITE